MRVHPLLEWTELDIWRYVEREAHSRLRTLFCAQWPALPVAGRGGHHVSRDFRAATLAEIISELETTRAEERAGRAMDHEREDAFERLRAAGYM